MKGQIGKRNNINQCIGNGSGAQVYCTDYFPQEPHRTDSISMLLLSCYRKTTSEPSTRYVKSSSLLGTYSWHFKGKMSNLYKMANDNGNLKKLLLELIC